MKIIEFRSDTCSMPDEEMRSVIAKAECGAESWNEDPSVNRLLEEVCRISGKEAAIFAASGTMANLVSQLTWADYYPAGSEIIGAEYSHTYWYECGGYSRIAGLSFFPVKCTGGYLTEDLLDSAVRPKNGHAPKSALLWLENTYMLGGGMAVSGNVMESLHRRAAHHGLGTHLDGARLYNAAAALKTTVKELASHADTVMLCFSKGVGAPFGAALCGSKEFIERASFNKTMVGGGFRQAGIMASACLFGLKRAEKQIPIDNENAKNLALGIDKIYPGAIDLKATQTNIVLFRGDNVGIDNNELRDHLWKNGIKTLVVPVPGGYACRFVTYNGIDENDVKRTIETIAAFKK